MSISKQMMTPNSKNVIIRQIIISVLSFSQMLTLNVYSYVIIQPVDNIYIMIQSDDNIYVMIQPFDNTYFIVYQGGNIEVIIQPDDNTICSGKSYHLAE
jgi:hypothetical protein